MKTHMGFLVYARARASSALFMVAVAASSFAACTTPTAPNAPVIATGDEAGVVFPDRGDSGMSDAEAAADAVDPLSAIVPSKLVTDLQALGIDTNRLPTLDSVKQDPNKLRAVMNTFAKSLGVDCNGCHAAGEGGAGLDYAASTPSKNVAWRMWERFVGGLAFADGTALYCDSCHQGNRRMLDRSDDTKVTAWMTANFVDKLRRRDGAVHSCETCHGTPFDRGFLSLWRAGQ